MSRCRQLTAALGHGSSRATPTLRTAASRHSSTRCAGGESSGLSRTTRLPMVLCRRASTALDASAQNTRSLVTYCCGMSVHCVLYYLLLDYMGWWAPVCCGMSVLCAVLPPPGLYGVVGTGLLGLSVHCVLYYLLLDYMGWWAPVWCWMSVHRVLEYPLLDLRRVMPTSWLCSRWWSSR
jgi:hypothetical protein